VNGLLRVEVPVEVVAIGAAVQAGVLAGEVFSTAADNQSDVEVHVLQGERPLARDNRTLGRFHLGGIVNVSAKDQATGKEQTITITASSGLSKDEVDRLVKEAQAHADADRKRREEIEARNEADSQAYRKERHAETPPTPPGGPGPSNVADGEVIDAEPAEAPPA
jgi:molecular chaperone DnaK (HSP70)